MLYSENIKVTKQGIIFSDKQGNRLSLSHALKKANNRFDNWLWDFELLLVHFISLHCPFYSVRKLIFELAGVKIGKGTKIHMGCKFFNPSGIEIGQDSVIGDRAFLDGRDRLKIGSHTDIASEVMIYNSEHDINSSDFSAFNQPVEIGDYVFIGPRAIILPNVKIGKGAIIGAGAVVTKNVDEYEVVGGVPARVIGERKLKTPNYRLGRTRLFQ